MKLPEIDKARATEWVLVLLLLAVCWFGGDRYGRARAIEEAEMRRDTVTKIVPVWKDAPKPAKTAPVGHVAVPAYKFISDTIERVKTAEIVLHDTTVVYLQREQKYYEEDEGRLRLWVSGYDPRLDRWELDRREQIVTQTVVERQRWSLGVSAGWGVTYDVIKKSLGTGPTVAVGASYRF